MFSLLASGKQSQTSTGWESIKLEDWHIRDVQKAVDTCISICDNRTCIQGHNLLTFNGEGC